MHRYTINLDDDVYESLRKRAFEKRTTISRLIHASLRAEVQPDTERRTDALAAKATVPDRKDNVHPPESRSKACTHPLLRRSKGLCLECGAKV
jgi:plasmid stability protein